MDFKQTRHKFQGMMSDMGPDTLKAQEYYVDAHNIRLTHNSDNKQFVITNDRFSDLKNINTANWNVIGSIEVEQYIIVFDKLGYVRIIDTDEYEQTSSEPEQPFSITCDFTGSTHVDAVSYRRNDKQLFVYFVDGVHGLRRIAIEDDNDPVIEETNIEITDYLGSNIDVTSIFNSRGGYEGGTVQYYISVIKDNNISAIVYQTPLYYPCYEERGLPPNRTGGQTFKLEINVPTAAKIRLFSVYKAEDNSTYVKYKDITLEDSEATVYDYNDNTWIATDITEVLVLNGTAFSAKTVELGDYNLFMGNLGTLNANQHIRSDYPKPSSVSEWSDDYNGYFAIQTEIIKNGNKYNTPENLDDFKSKVKIIPASIPSDNEFYSYDNQLARSSKDIKIFKRRDSYVFGYQLQDKYGQWSDVVPIGNNIMLANPSLGYYTYTFNDDAVSPTRTNYHHINDGNYYISIPNARINISDLRDDYIAIRPMVIYPTESQRNIIAQGIICPTVYQKKDTSIIYPHWYYVDFSCGTNIKFYQDKDSCIIDGFECYYDDSSADTTDENKFRVNTNYFTLNSPDKSTTPYIDSTKFRINGMSHIWKRAKKTVVNTENKSFNYTYEQVQLGDDWVLRNLKIGDLEAHQNQNDLHVYDSIARSSEYEDYYTAPIRFRYTSRNHVSGEADTGWYWTSSQYEHIIFPWARTGSVTNDSSNNFDVLKNKTISESIVTYENEYIDSSKIGFDCETLYSDISNYNMSIASDVYNTNVDVILPATENRKNIWDFAVNEIINNYNFKNNIAGFNKGNIYDYIKIDDTFNTLTNISYTSESNYLIHSELPLYIKSSIGDNYSEESIINSYKSKLKEGIHTSIDGVLIGELYRDSAEFSPESNNWCIAGDTVKMPKTGYNVTLFWTEGDTYFQRYDLLKTVPYSTGEKENNIVEILSCFLESHVNGAGRYDTLRGLKDNTMIDENSFKLNENYNQENNLQQFSTFKPEDLELSGLSNWITWSKKDTDMTVDKYGVFDGTQMLKMNSPVTSIVNYNSHLISLNRDNISAIRYNENVQIPTTESGAIRIASDDSVSGYNIINNYIGCQRIETVYDDKSGIYFGDDNTKTLYLYNGEFTPLSDRFLMKSWFESNPDWSTFGDKSHNDVYFTGSADVLNFNEEINSFVSRFSYSNCKFIHSTKNGSYSMFNNGIHKLFSGSYTWYDITFLDNEQPYDFKIFNNIEFRADMFGEGQNNVIEIKNNAIPFDGIQCNTEFNSGSEELEYETTKPSNLQKRFRTWRINIPRENGSEIRLSDNWMKTTLSSENEDGKRLKFYDLVTNFYY